MNREQKLDKALRNIGDYTLYNNMQTKEELTAAIRVIDKIVDQALKVEDLNKTTIIEAL